MRSNAVLGSLAWEKPETLAAKLLKVRENKARLAAERQGLVLVKCRRPADDARPYMLKYAGPRSRYDDFWWRPPGYRRYEFSMNLAGLEAALRDMRARSETVRCGPEIS